MGRGGLSAEEVVHSVLTRIAEVNQKINAFALLDAEGALVQARQRDNARARGLPPGALEGVPIHVKDLVPTAGMETAYGSFVMAGNIPAADVCAVARLRAAGAILIGKTTTPEYGSKILTESPRHGHTRNPWNLARSPGGSSGGAAAAVSAGMGPLAINTDGAGSARVPAACCGVLGFKPSIGLVPNEMAAALFENNQYLGLNTRTVADLALALSVMNGPDPADPWTVGRSRLVLSCPTQPLTRLRGLRVLYVPTMGNRLIEHSIRALLESLLDQLAGQGAEVRTLEQPFDWGIDISFGWLRGMLHARLGHLLASNRDRLSPDFAAALEAASHIPRSVSERLPLERTQLFRRVQQLFENADLIVSPTIAAPSIGLEHRVSEPLLIDGEVAGPLREAWYPYAGVANLTGHPAISVPMGLAADGTPAGLHAMARLQEDQLLIDVASAIEVLRPWAAQWPSCDLLA
ncbi:MAG: amidase [Hylemonella sp.]